MKINTYANVTRKFGEESINTNQSNDLISPFKELSHRLYLSPDLEKRFITGISYAIKEVPNLTQKECLSFCKYWREKRAFDRQPGFNPLLPYGKHLKDYIESHRTFKLNQEHQTIKNFIIQKVGLHQSELHKLIQSGLVTKKGKEYYDVNFKEMMKKMDVIK
jgi:hypothetical protein